MFPWFMLGIVFFVRRKLTLLHVWSGSLLVMAVPASLQERLSYQAVGGPGSEAPTILWNYSHCTRITRQR